MDPFTIAAIASATKAGAGIVQGITGIVQKNKAKKMALANKRPLYKIPGTIEYNNAIAERNASRGLSGEAKNLYQQQTDRGLTSGIDAITSGNGTLGNIAELYSAGSDSLSKMAIIDDSMRSINQKNLVDDNRIHADYEDKEWQLNQYAPYADTAQAAAALADQGEKNKWKGVNTVVGAVSDFATASQYKSESENVFPKRDGFSSDGHAAGIEISPYSPQMDSSMSVSRPQNISPYSGPPTGFDSQGYATGVPMPIQSSLLRQQPTNQQIMQRSWTGLMGGPIGRRRPR